MGAGPIARCAAVWLFLIVSCGDADSGAGDMSRGSQRKDQGGASGGTLAGTGGTLGDPMFDNPGTTDAAVSFDASIPEGEPLEDCGPGTYVGTYKCPLRMGGMDLGLVLEGAVQFSLEIDESVVAGECEEGEEFCFDLVIAEGSGTLFGFVNFFIGFETQLEGGLDCTSGDFYATAIDGVWGLPVPSDPSDPMSPATVNRPPTGNFDGILDGAHLGGDPQRIEGIWDLTEDVFGYQCPGPFTVTRMK